MNYFLKKLLVHEVFRSMVSWATEFFFEKFVISSGPASCILNVRSLTFRILETYPSKDIELDLSRYVTVMAFLWYLPITSHLNQRFQFSQLLKCDGNTVITQ